MIWGIFLFFFLLVKISDDLTSTPPFQFASDASVYLACNSIKVYVNEHKSAKYMYFIRVQKILQTDKINVWVPFAAVPAEIVALLTI